MEISRRASYALSFVWGLCEASFFFLVPDIWLSRLAMKDFRAALRNTAFATAGAVLGGLVMYLCGRYAFSGTTGFLDMIPAISPAMIDDAGAALTENGLLPALLEGMAGGMPYKIYAAWGGHMALSVPLFLLASAAARFLRFFIVTGLFYAAARGLSAHLSARNLLRLHALTWAVFYAGYFLKFGIF